MKKEGESGARMKNFQSEPERTDGASPSQQSSSSSDSGSSSASPRVAGSDAESESAATKEMPVERQREIRQLTLQRPGSVRHIAALFMGNSIPDTAESFQQKMRRTFSASGARASNTQLRKFTRIDKERFLRNWATSITLQDAADDGVTRDNAIAFLGSCGVSMQTVGVASWLQWVEAIDLVVAHNRCMSFDCVDFNSCNTSLEADPLSAAMRNAVCDDSDFSAWLNAGLHDDSRPCSPCAAANAAAAADDDAAAVACDGYCSDDDDPKWLLGSELKPLKVTTGGGGVPGAPAPTSHYPYQRMNE